jgi:RNA-directed DNA polymerase
MLEGRVAGSSAEVMSPAEAPRYEWNATPWPRLESGVFKLQKRIYRASLRGDTRMVHRLQRLLVNSNSAKLLAARRVTQDNSGKKTAGVDGKLALTPKERMELASTLAIKGKSLPVRRVWIPKPDKDEKRPLGIPVIRDRARQALLKLALEPEWEARFERNSYGFRPGRSCHDAIEAIFDATTKKTAYVLDADIAGCFDNIDQSALLAKMRTFPTFRRVVRGWLKAGVLDGTVFQETDRGTPQGGVISPLLANIALHGLETETRKALLPALRQSEKRRRGGTSLNAGVFYSVIRYADDFVVIHHDLEIILMARKAIEEWLMGMGLELKPSKTRIRHTMETMGEEPAGFNFLGFHVQQVRASDRRKGWKLLIRPSREGVKRHLAAIRQELRRMRGAPQEAVIQRLNPIVKGWSRYYNTAISRKVFEACDHEMHQKLWRWARFKHHRKGRAVRFWA